MIRLIFFLTTFTSLAVTQPRLFHKTVGTSTAASTNARGTLRNTTPPKVAREGPKPPLSAKTSSKAIASLKTTFKAVSQRPRPLRFQKLDPKAITSSRTTLKAVIQGATPLHFRRGTKKTVAPLKTTASPEVIASSKSNFITELQMFLMKLDTDYEGRYRSGNVGDHCNSLDGIQEGLKHVWSELMKDQQNHSSGETNDLQQFLKKVVEDYNLCIEYHFYANSEAAWKNYIIAFGKEYTTEEEGMRKAIFMKNKEYMEEGIELFRNGRLSYGTKLNYLSDRTRKELEGMKGFRPRKLLTKRRHPSRMIRENDTRYYHVSPGSELPASVDWRAEGYVTSVKFQGDCSSCYAFAGIGALEAYHKKKMRKLVTLSVQNILDCTWNHGNDGCSGGFIDSVFEYAKAFGVESEYRYPYTMNASHDCQRNTEHVAVLFFGNVQTVVTGNELALQHAVANHGPVAAGVGTRGSFENYGYGIFDPSNCGSVDHSVLVVGYDTDPIQGDYWIAKNSYGEWWGEDGYIRIARNKNNVCGVASHAVFPSFD